MTTTKHGGQGMKRVAPTLIYLISTFLLQLIVVYVMKISSSEFFTPVVVGGMVVAALSWRD